MALYALDFPTSVGGSRGPLRADNASLSLAGDWTIEFWYKQTAAGGKTDNAIVCKKHSGVVDFSYKVYLNGDEEIRAYVHESSSGLSYNARGWSGLSALDDGNWHHVAISFDVSEAHATQFILYLDGSSQGNGSSVASLGSVNSIFNSNSDFVLGGASGGSDELRSARLFDVRVWNDVRTSTEVNDNKLIRVSAAEAGLVSNWLTGGSREHRDIGTNTIIDRNANANHLTHATVTSAQTPDYVADWPSAYSATSETDYGAHEEAIQTGYTFSAAIDANVGGFDAPLGGGFVAAPDTTPPTVTNVTPTPGELNADARIARITPISFDVTDADPGIGLVMVTLSYAGGEERFVVHDGTDFIYPFDSDTSERTIITGGYSFTVLPRMGWKGSPTLYVHRVDSEGNVGTP